MEHQESIYREYILDLNKNPHNKKVLKDFDFRNREVNPLCGDEIELYLKFENEKVSDVGFQGGGCAISQASASALTDHVIGMTKYQLESITRKEVLALLGLESLNPTRQRCALLALKTLQSKT